MINICGYVNDKEIKSGAEIKKKVDRDEMEGKRISIHILRDIYSRNGTKEAGICTQFCYAYAFKLT